MSCTGFTRWQAGWLLLRAVVCPASKRIHSDVDSFPDDTDQGGDAVDHEAEDGQADAFHLHGARKLAALALVLAALAWAAGALVVFASARDLQSGACARRSMRRAASSALRPMAAAPRTRRVVNFLITCSSCVRWLA